MQGLDSEGQKVVDEQWEGIVSSLTNELKQDVRGPIEWVRVHNLPDHVYFNHSQHVSVGKIDCQQCHGKVEEMPVVGQYAPLSMGWCVNCHRQTSVKLPTMTITSPMKNFMRNLQMVQEIKLLLKKSVG